MFNDCDHTCSKAVGFSCPGVVLHCSECESEKKLRTLVKNKAFTFILNREDLMQAKIFHWVALQYS